MLFSGMHFMDFSWIFHGFFMDFSWYITGISMDQYFIRKEIRTLDARKRNTELRGLAKKALQAGCPVGSPWE
jgi:hypothetical protein